jgi:hypothetical protein
MATCGSEGPHTLATVSAVRECATLHSIVVTGGVPHQGSRDSLDDISDGELEVSNWFGHQLEKWHDCEHLSLIMYEIILSLVPEVMVSLGSWRWIISGKFQETFN